ncbi:MAG: T9SS type A sorting domain-containing protein [Candidatus Kapabacteria bacterium]|nr:T9SS type A sorting domain-containing protein [Candidatus Kapabacteria bacterium]
MQTIRYDSCRAPMDRSCLRGLTVLAVLCCTVIGLSAQSAWREFAQLRQGRHHHAVRYLKGDRLLVIGGYLWSRGILDGTTTNTTEIIDLTTGQVSPGPSMRYAHAEFPTIVLSNGDILVIGGFSNDGGNRVIEKLDVTTMQWSVVGTMNRSRRQHAADYLSADEILIFGGYNESSAEILDLTMSQCRMVRALPSAANSAVSVNPDGRGPSYFGFRTGGANSDRSRKSLRYDGVNDVWVNDLEFDDSPVAPGVTVVNDGSVLVVGGAVKETPFMTSTASWIVSPLGVVSKGPSLQVGRQHLSAGTWRQDLVLIAGGIADFVTITDAVEWLDLQTMKSTSGPNLNTARCYAPMVMAPSADGRMRAFVVSGLAGSFNTPSIEMLEDSTCTLREISQDLSEMRLAGSAKYDSKSIGLTTAGQYLSGGAFLRNRVGVRNGFDLKFSFRLSEGNDNGLVDNGSPGADGVAVVFLPDSPTALGRPGDGIGYHEITHGIAVEYDSYLNAAFSDPNGSHVAVQVGDGRRLRAWHAAPYLRALATKDVPSFKADGSVYHGRIKYEAATLQVFVSTTRNFGTPVIEIKGFDIDSILRLDSRGSCFVGFTSSTGLSSEIHELLSVELSDCQPLTTSVKEGRSDAPINGIIIAPNPAVTDVVVALQAPLAASAMLRILDVSGTVVAWQAVPAGSTEIMIDSITALSSGTYQLQIFTEFGIHSAPLVLVR